MIFPLQFFNRWTEELRLGLALQRRVCVLPCGMCSRATVSVCEYVCVSCSLPYGPYVLVHVCVSAVTFVCFLMHTRVCLVAVAQPSTAKAGQSQAYRPHTVTEKRSVSFQSFLSSSPLAAEQTCTYNINVHSNLQRTSR